MRRITTLFATTLAGRLVYALSSLLMLPWFVSLFGSEAAGLLSFFTTMLLTLMVLEGGLTSSLIREVSSIRRDKTSAPLRNQRISYARVNTYLVVFVAIGTVVGLGVALTAEQIATAWLNTLTIGPIQAKESILYMGVFIGLNFPIMALQGTLTAQERHLALNAVFIPYSILRTLGILIACVSIPGEAKVQYFFLLQAWVQLVYFAALLYLCYCNAPLSDSIQPPRWKVITRNKRFARDVFLLSITSAVVVQFDKIYLSGKITLDEYASYGLAYTFSTIPYIFSSAIHAVLFPRFSSYIAQRNSESLRSTFDSALCQFARFMALVTSAAWFFSDLALRPFFADQLATAIAKILPILLTAAAMQAILVVSFVLQLASGATKIPLLINLAAIPFLILLIPAAAELFGTTGVAWVYFGYNLASSLVTYAYLSRQFTFIPRALVRASSAILKMLLIALPIYWVERTFIITRLDDIPAIAIVALTMCALTLKSFSYKEIK